MNLIIANLYLSNDGRCYNSRLLFAAVAHFKGKPMFHVSANGFR